MKKLSAILLLLMFFSLNAQTTANRFFYELTFKPKKDSTKLDKVMTILDVTKEKSVYQDFTVPAQDSIIVAAVKEMERTKVWKDLMKSVHMPKFSYKIEKTYPEMKLRYVDRISRNLFAYDENTKFNWKIEGEKQKIGDYNTQKATTEFGGRKWTAWFSSDIPFQDGPYKFYGLPGLIVKVEDDAKNYSWLLKGNKTIADYSEQSEADKINAKYGMDMAVKPINKDKFEQAYNNYKADPLAEYRPYMKPEMMSQKMPGSETTIGDYIKQQEKMAKDFFNANDNPIELQSATAGKTKK